MENLSTEATYALIVAIATLITSIAGWIKVASSSKSRESIAKARNENLQLDFQKQILVNNRHFQKEIDDLRAENLAEKNARIVERQQWESSNKKLSDELKAQLDGQALERAEVRTEISNYQSIVLKQGEQLAEQDHQIRELNTQVAGFKTLVDQVVADRNQIKAQLEQVTAERDAALKASIEKDGIIAALKAEKDALVLDFDTRIKKLEAAIVARDQQIAALTEQVQKLTLEKALEDVPTEPKPAGLSEAVKIVYDPQKPVIDGKFTATPQADEKPSEPPPPAA